MDFEEVKWYDLKKGETYKIIKTYRRDNILVSKELKGKFISCNYNFQNYAKFNIKNHLVELEIYPFKYNKLYKPITKQKVQNKMERRALHLILRKIVGDDCFVWY